MAALRGALTEVPGGQTWRLAGRAGAQAYSHARRDVLHPLGPDGVKPYADVTGEAVFGPIALESRMAAEPRIVDDPEWPGRKDLELAWRFPEAYLSAQFKYGELLLRADGSELGSSASRASGSSNYAYRRSSPASGGGSCGVKSSLRKSFLPPLGADALLANAYNN